MKQLLENGFYFATKGVDTDSSIIAAGGMPLAAGTRIGPYEVVAMIGAGGMGEVYRAKDSQLGRDVAIKVLPDAFTQNTERLSRFDREAKALATLNHPGIAHIYGLEESDRSKAIVLELVEGDILADRVVRERIQMNEALEIARQIADALEAAHEQGIVHRDLKPANIKVRRDGTVKVLDFGLAKSTDTSGVAESGWTELPTITTPALTRAGVVLGTAAYMSPEQARNKPVDKRADIWAFGCVLFEMLTGRRAFDGDDVADVLACVVKTEPEWQLLPAATPASIRMLLRRCLEKEPSRRLRDIGDARIEITDVLSGRSAQLAGSAQTSAAHARLRIAAWAAAAAIGALVGAAAVWLGAPSRSIVSTSGRYLVPLQPGDELVADVALSPDGTHLAYRSGRPGAYTLRLRNVRESNDTPGAEFKNATDPFFSPDSQWLGLFAGGKLKKVPVRGGPATVLADAPATRGGSWGDDGWIVFAPTGRSGLMRVSERGGIAEILTTPDASRGETSHVRPQVLPGARAVLYAARGETLPESHVTIVSVADKRSRRLMEGADPRYLRTGRLVYRYSNTLMAAPFDLARQEPTATPVPVMEGIAAFDSSDTGSLLYVPPTPSGASGPQRLVWVARDGGVEPLETPGGQYGPARVSRDGRRVVVVRSLGDDLHLWTYDVNRRTFAKFTLEGRNSWPVWSRDGREIFYSINTVGTSWDLFKRPADGNAPAEPLLRRPALQHPEDVTPDGRFVAFSEVTPTGAETWLLSLIDRTARPFIKGVAPSFSPDGKWVAYASSGSGQSQIYVQAVSGSAGSWQVSTTGGVEPLWSPTGKELFYRDGNGVFAVNVQTESGFAFGNAEKLFEGNYALDGLFSRRYDVTSDGQRFLMAARTPTTRPLNIVLNWRDELLARVPVR